MNTNMTGFERIFKKILRSCALDKSSLSIGRVKVLMEARSMGNADLSESSLSY